MSHDQATNPSAPPPATPAAPAGAAAPAAAAAAKAPAPATNPGEPLPSLMAAPAATPAGPNLDADALRAARQAIAAGEKALATAAAQLSSPSTGPRQRRRFDLVFGAVLFVNLVALVLVASLPPATATTTTTTTATDSGPATPPVASQPVAPKDDAALRAFNAPFQRALAAADRGDYAGAAATLEAYLAGTPSLQPSQQVNVLNMLSHYASLANDFGRAQDFAQRAAGIGQSHSLPADLVAMAKAAAASGDQESLRRVWARFLLQQRQVPSWLYKHVAQAYLELGDSYRDQASAGADRERVRQLQEAAARLAERKTDAVEGGK